MHYLLGGILLVISSFSYAQIEAFLLPHSTHVSACSSGCDGGDYNETNQVIGFRYGRTVAFTMRNSFYERSYFIGRATNWIQTPHITLAGIIGGITGYEHLPVPSYEGVTPTALIYLDVHPINNKFGFILAAMPTGAISAGIRLTF